MIRQSVHSLAAVLLLTSLAAGQNADQPDSKSTTEIKPVDAQPTEEQAAQISKLIGDLQAPKFTVRKKATIDLIKLGAVAVPAVAKATESETAEVRARAMEILKGMYSGGDEATKKAATAALKKIADGKDELLAIRAKQIIRPVAGPNEVQPNRGIFGGRGGIQVATRIVNGEKTVDAKENGVTYKFVIGNNKAVKVEVTSNDAKGKPQTKKYEAKSLADLKTKHPQIHAAYERFTKLGGRLNIAIGGIGGAPRVQPVRRVLPIGVHVEDLDKVNQKLDELIKKLGEATEKGKIDDVKKIAGELKKVQESVKKIRADADKGIEGRMRKSFQDRGIPIPR